MVESREHNQLKDIALIWLLNQGCFLVDKEVPLSQIGLIRYTNLDMRTVIDALGVGMRHSTLNGHTEGSDDFDPSELNGVEAGECTLRGVEVKVTRSDFHAGFACSGCNYHYLLTPLRLLSPWEVPKGIGLIEYNKHKFTCEYDEKLLDRPYKFDGLRVVKHATYRQIPRFIIDCAIANIARRNLNLTRRRIVDEVMQGSSSPPLVKLNT